MCVCFVLLQKRGGGGGGVQSFLGIFGGLRLGRKFWEIENGGGRRDYENVIVEMNSSEGERKTNNVSDEIVQIMLDFV